MTTTTTYEGDRSGRVESHYKALAAEGSPLADLTRPAITSPERAADLIVPALAPYGGEKEAAAVLLLDTKHRVLDTVIATVGTLDHTFMDPRTVYRAALLANAAAIVVGHNHPSGDPEPSDDDVAVTARLYAAGDLLGIELLDHLVVGGADWRSVARQNPGALERLLRLAGGGKS